ncbi:MULTISPECIES: winged helix-turn-helix domain-containing protein [Streptomyces]|uniref:winged helix-turn-helix domain-containing protein n=1 Tax=Streptomyces sp. SID5469 TaxID=2690296 RepID=UPI0020D00B1D|nr:MULTISPECIES: winged helix-turn-helix domain-containing protein [Streptomyces]
MWTRRLVGEPIFKLYRVRFTEPGVGKYLMRWGLTFPRPDKRAIQQDPEAVRIWREETWRAIPARAKAENGVVLFADQVGIRSDQVELHFLPSYSPDLNPDELVDADLKRSLPHTHRARNQTELASETRRFFHRRQHQPHIVRGYFCGRHVGYVIDE